MYVYILQGTTSSRQWNETLKTATKALFFTWSFIVRSISSRINRKLHMGAHFNTSTSIASTSLPTLSTIVKYSLGNQRKIIFENWGVLAHLNHESEMTT